MKPRCVSVIFDVSADFSAFILVVSTVEMSLKGDATIFEGRVSREMDGREFDIDG